MGTNGTRLTKQYGLCEARTTKTADTGHSVTRPRPTKTPKPGGKDANPVNFKKPLNNAAYKKGCELQS